MDDKHDEAEHNKPRAAEKPPEKLLITDWEKGEIGWDSPDDPENPRNWTRAHKWRTVAFVSLSSFIQPLSSTLFAPGAALVAKEFGGVSTMMTSFMVSIYVLGFGWGPLMYGPLSENYGRKYVVSTSLVLFALMNVGCSEATGLGMFLAFRFLGGFLGSAGMSVGGGVISDIFKREEIGAAAAFFSAGPLMGPIVGPIAGGFIAETIGWRWSFRILLIVGCVLAVAFLTGMDETNANILLRRKARKLAKETERDLIAIPDIGKEPQSILRIIVDTIFRPLRILATTPILLCLSLYMAIVMAYLYIFFTTITTVFLKVYKFSVGTAGLCYLGLGIGLTIGLVSIGMTNDALVRYLTKHRGHGVRMPEYRLPPLVLGSVLVPASVFWFGWSVESRCHWIVPVIGLAPMGIGMICANFTIQTYVIEIFAVRGTSASAVAGLNVFRMTLTSVIPLFGPKLFERLGYGWGSSVLGFIAIGFCIPVTILFLLFGPRIRKLAGL